MGGISDHLIFTNVEHQSLNLKNYTVLLNHRKVKTDSNYVPAQIWNVEQTKMNQEFCY